MNRKEISKIYDVLITIASEAGQNEANGVELVHEVIANNYTYLLQNDTTYDQAIYKLTLDIQDKIQPPSTFSDRSYCPFSDVDEEFDCSSEDDFEKLKSLVLEDYISEQPFPTNKIVSMHAYEGMSPKEIARKMNLKGSTTRSYIHRFIKKAKIKIPILMKKYLDRGAI